MNNTDIQNILQSISNLNQDLSTREYELTPLDRNSLKGLIEQLYVALINEESKNQTSTSSNKPEPSLTNNPVLPHSYSSTHQVVQPSVEKQIVQSAVEEVNQEIEEVFTAPTQDVMVSKPIKQTEPFRLGINERLMFAKELFEDDNQALDESLRQLKSFDQIEDAAQFFDKKLRPFLISEGKDEEIIEEYRSLLVRMY